jgi:hypothetical protein
MNKYIAILLLAFSGQSFATQYNCSYIYDRSLEPEIQKQMDPVNIEIRVRKDIAFVRYSWAKKAKEYKIVLDNEFSVSIAQSTSAAKKGNEYENHVWMTGILIDKKSGKLFISTIGNITPTKIQSGSCIESNKE